MLETCRGKCKGKAVPLRAFSGPEASRKLRFPDFMKTQGVGRFSDLRTGCLYPKEKVLVLIPARGCVDPGAIMRTERFYVNYKFQ